LPSLLKNYRHHAEKYKNDKLVASALMFVIREYFSKWTIYTLILIAFAFYTQLTFMHVLLALDNTKISESEKRKIIKKIENEREILDAFEECTSDMAVLSEYIIDISDMLLPRLHGPSAEMIKDKKRQSYELFLLGRKLRMNPRRPLTKDEIKIVKRALFPSPSTFHSLI